MGESHKERHKLGTNKDRKFQRKKETEIKSQNKKK